jgi:hypothetical protein
VHLLSQDDAVARALALGRTATARERTIDITTTGARTGEARRIETWFYRVGERFYLTGLPGRRGWHANLLAQPSFTFHLKHGVSADLPAMARPVTAVAERRAILAEILASQPDDPAGTVDPAELERWVAGSPLVEVTFTG